jgi:hypothetical protein
MRYACETPQHARRCAVASRTVAVRALVRWAPRRAHVISIAYHTAHQVVQRCVTWGPLQAAPHAPGPGLGRRTRHAPTHGPLSPRPGDTICYDGPAGAGSDCTVESYRNVPRYGDGFLAPRDRGSTGAACPPASPSTTMLPTERSSALAEPHYALAPAKSCRSVWRDPRCPHPRDPDGESRGMSARPQASARSPSLELQTLDCLRADVQRAPTHDHDTRALYRVIFS